jgi:hypothetical protein
MRGLPLANLEIFVEEFRRALREFDRQRRAEPTRRGGHPKTREEQVTAFRLVEFAPGSALMTLEPDIRKEAGDQKALAEVEPLPVENLNAFLDAIARPDEIIDPAVTEAVERARRALGADGKIEIKLGGRRRPRRSALIDHDVVAGLERRVAKQREKMLRISGRLHMIDLEPDRIGIRAPNGVDWSCSYPSELEDEVKSLVDSNVAARGVGRLVSPAKGTLRIEDIRPVGEFEQTPLFAFEQVAVADLIAQQGIRAPRGPVSILPADVDDEDVDAFLAALDE